jgi:hypothetical protein
MVNKVADVPILLTPGKIAEALGEPLPRILRILASRPHIQPAARAGVLRLYRKRAIEDVRAELQSIDARRGEGGQ